VASRWQTRLDALAQQYEVPGASLAVWHGGVLETAATGVINRNTRVDTTPDTLFQIGSITKLLTGTQTLQLIEEGRIGLDDPVRRHLPDFTLASPDAAFSITLRQLLTHTSGIDGDFFENTGIGEDKLARYVEACRLLPLLHAPGEFFSYCNVGFNLLGRVIELQRGTTWETALQRSLCGRLGPNTFVRYAHETPKYRTAIGHIRADPADPLMVSPVAYLPLASAPAGSTLCATATDLILFARTIIDGGTAPSGEEILKPASVARMLEQQIRLPSGNPVDAFGLAFMLFDWGGTRVVGHDGATIGQNAYLRMVPEHNTAVALLTNGGFPAELFQQLFTEVFDELLGIHPPARPAPSPKQPDDIEAFRGVFEKLSQRITVASIGKRLTATIEGTRYPAPAVTYDLQAFGADAFIGTLPGSPTPALFHYLSNSSANASANASASASGRRFLMTGSRLHPERSSAL
jgi:CubicO group peptidase (beta-lactamase class C family)